MKRIAGVIVSIVSAAALAACQTVAVSDGSPAKTSWAIDAVGQKCMASVIGGAIVGGLIGAIAGGGDRVAQGAIAGGAAGVGLCAVIMALDAQDRSRIREAQLKAAETNQAQTLSYKGDDGLQRNISVRPSRKVVVAKADSGPRKIVGPASKADDPVLLASQGRAICTELLTSAAVETKGSTDVPAQYVCKDEDGTLAPVVVASAL